MVASAMLHAQQDSCLKRCQGRCQVVLHLGSCGCLCCRSSLATPRILTPAGARRTDVRMSDEVMWRESVDSTSAAAGRGLPRAAGGPSLGECTGSPAACGGRLAVPACTGRHLGSGHTKKKAALKARCVVPHLGGHCFPWQTTIILVSVISMRPGRTPCRTSSTRLGQACCKQISACRCAPAAVGTDLAAGLCSGAGAAGAGAS